MNKNHLLPRRLMVGTVCVILLAGGAFLFERRSRAQGPKPVLVSDAASTRAIALDSVTHLREPFALTPPVAFSADNRTRVVLFALNVAQGETVAALTADAEDGAHNIYPLTVENVAQVTGQEWISSITVRLNDNMGNVGDVLVRLTYHGVASNRVRMGIGHIGDGPADDPGSAPTPASVPVPTPVPAAAAPTPNTNPLTAGMLTPDDVKKIISQAVSAAVALNVKVTVAVTDREGNVLGLFKMTGAPATTHITGGGTAGQGLEGANVPSTLAAISKAGTPSFFSTFGDAFTTRTAGFIIQEHFPPGIKFQSGGPLFGVQFSSLPCTDIKFPATLPLGLSADPGSMPIFKNGVPSGGVGIEGDGVYTIDKNPTLNNDKPFEELIAVAAGRGYEPPDLIRGDNILVNGIRLAYLNASETDAPNPPLIPFDSLPGSLDPLFPTIRGAQPSAFVPASLGAVQGTVDTRFFPFKGSASTSPNALTAADVTTIIAQAAEQADITRAAIRQPLGSAARVNITVVDRDGVVLGIFRTTDAPVFGFDVSAQKARTAAFNSNPIAGATYRADGLGVYADAAAAVGVKFDGTIAFSDRATGFMHRPFFPDGIDGTLHGPLSKGFPDWSVFNVGLQLDLLVQNGNLLTAIGNYPAITPPCTKIPNIAHGVQIFPGSVPLYKNGELVGAIGISGDGVDQDDIIASAGSNGFAAPPQIRADTLIVRGTRLPYVKFPRSPDL